ncbi:integrase [Sphingobium sp. TA15]|uniref:Invertase/recombinase like protein n=1 Tax=Sphingobium indicum (strain DSM 16413 / CCM 7287 / MTCC 6362 / UT26 / NBRC 101211 / UT26S) TaxID=452662 RepID=D4YYL3_SPHIU|nr:recombinase family protein [Sphingobium indicum]BAI95445.1 invertase/recombinase like protein [Sphingobium indicum UT26S]BDD68225.1 integrase [Sphingobium sp. TA15]
MIVGYARVSTTDQCLAVQMDELAAHGCDRIFQDQASGTSRARAGLVEMMQFVREGDTIVVSRLDRFARSLTDLFQLLDELSRKGVAFQCVHQSIDTSSSTGKLTLAILGAVAEFENDIRRERQRAGIAKAKANGVYKGRRAKINAERVREMAAQGFTASTIASELGCHRQSAYRLLRTAS